MCQRVLRGIEVSDETLARDLMIEKGPGKDFLVEEHTVRHMRDEFFFPRLAHRGKRETAEPATDAQTRVMEFIEEVRTSDYESGLDWKTRQRILDVFPGIRVPVLAR